jgi:hypothetical protein
LSAFTSFAEADAGLQELAADAVVQAHALRDLDDVGAGLLADVRDLVDEGDLRREERVRGELHHLGARDVRADELAVLVAAVGGGEERAVQLGDGVAGPVARVPDDDAVGPEEVVDRRALLQELGARDVAEAVLPLLGEDPPDGRARADRDGRLHDERVPIGGRHRRDDGVHRREVGVARVRGRGADRDEEQARVLERIRDVRREMQAVLVLGDELRQARLVDRDLARLQALDLLGIDVDAVDVAAEGSEASCRDQADVPGADDADRLAFSGAHGAAKASEHPRWAL